MKTLISFLGKQQKGYRTARYCFDKNTTIEQSYFGLALAQHIKPEHIVLVGTASSMWDVFTLDQDASAELFEQINTAIETHSLNEAILEDFSAFLTKRLDCRVTCILIDFARDTAGQIEILSRLSTVITQSPVIIDVTHGFRHLPMLSLVAARYLKHIRNITISEIFYGALDMTDNGETPVIRLGGMLQMLDWVEALAVYDKDGDYSGFSELLAREGISPAIQQCIEDAAFFERTTNVSKAREKLNTATAELERLQTPIYSLFKKELLERISWSKKQKRHEWESSLAKAYFKRNDYLRSLIYALESCISNGMNNQEIGQFLKRKERSETMKKSEDFRLLAMMRNGMAHGLFPDNRHVQKALEGGKPLREHMRKLYNALLDAK